VPPKIVLKVGFLERDFERDHLAEKSNRTKMGQKIHCAAVLFCTFETSAVNSKKVAIGSQFHLKRPLVSWR
jgi:hypothetical protein